MHSTLSPQLSFDLQTQHFCTTNWGLRSQRFRHFASAPLTLREQQLSRANKVARVTKMSGIQQGQPVNFALLYKNFGRNWGKKKKQRRPRRTCLVTAQNMHLKTGARHVRCHVADEVQKLSAHTWMTCLQIDSLSHWTLHDIVFHSARFSTQRQMMPCVHERRFYAQLVKTTQKNTFS